MKVVEGAIYDFHVSLPHEPSGIHRPQLRRVLCNPPDDARVAFDGLFERISSFDFVREVPLHRLGFELGSLQLFDMPMHIGRLHRMATKHLE